MSIEQYRETVNKVVEQRRFHMPSFKIYGGIAGLYDHGPPGVQLELNIIAFWREHFVREEDMLEMKGPCTTPKPVLKASGHVGKFTDLMVKDEKTGACYRADHLLKDHCNDKLQKDLSNDEANALEHLCATLDGLSCEELGVKLREFRITAPGTNNPLSDPYPFQLMFETSIGPSATMPAYMRPETAQGIFVDFNYLYDYNGEKLPFAAAQIGSAFRNEISPRQGLLRVREFTLAEIEHFVDPEDKSHRKFSEVENLKFFMFPREEQISGAPATRIPLGEAVSKGIVNSQALGYYIGRVYLFLTRLGIDKDRLRFRQHLSNEMAHYACDCWDAEIECSYGWIECVGIADRSTYDLEAHSEASGIPLVAHERFRVPKEEEKLKITPVNKVLGPVFSSQAKWVVESLMAMREEEAMRMKDDLESKGEVDFFVCALGKSVCITKNMVTISMVKKLVHERVFTPCVIEPSFGIGRIMHCLYEHSFYTRPSKAGDEKLNVFRFLPLVAPIKCSVFPLVRNSQYEEVANVISKSLKAERIAYKMDMTGSSIGKRYAKADELGVPFAITVDSTDFVTIRERDSRVQVRVNTEDAASVVKELSEGLTSWEDVLSRFSHHSSSCTSFFRFFFNGILPINSRHE